MSTEQAEQETIAAAPRPTVHEAWAGVMGAVQGVSKKERASMGGGGNFSFRGIDAVVNAAGPAMRAHGVHVRPVDVKVERRDTTTGNQKPTRETCVLVTYRVTGPAGDYFDGVAPGESLDSGDKGTAKAMSVAYRTFLLQGLTIPTDEPDPDAQHYERATPAQQQPVGPGSPDEVQRATPEQLRAWLQLDGLHPTARTMIDNRLQQLQAQTGGTPNE